MVRINGSPSSILIISIALFIIPGVSMGQELVAEMKLDGVFGALGGELGVLGDITGDGLNEMLVAGVQGVFIVSGSTGDMLSHVVIGSEPALSLCGIGDVDGDNLPDWAAGDGDTVRAFSSADGKLLWTRSGTTGGTSMGDTVIPLGDVNNDTIPDLAAGEPGVHLGGKSYTGRIWVLSGNDGSVINMIDGSMPWEKLGQRMDAVEDLNGDNRTDILVGDIVYNQDTGRIRVLSALDGSLILSIPGTVPQSKFGAEVADAGLVDGDNLSDLAVYQVNPSAEIKVYSSATKRLIWSTPVDFSSNMISVGDVNNDAIPEVVASRSFSFPPFGGEADVLDGATGTVLNTLIGFDEDAFQNIAAPGDLDGDGKAELLASTFQGSGFDNPSALVYNLPGGSVLHTITNSEGGDQLGRSVAVAGDLDADGKDDYIVASSSRLIVFAGDESGPILDVTVDVKFDWSTVDAIGLDDVTGDGVPDLAFSNGLWHGAVLFGGRLLILSGADGSLVDELQGTNAYDSFAYRMAATIDRNGDGVRDFFVSVTGKDLNNKKNAGLVLLLSGATREVLQTYDVTPQENGAFGSSVSAAGDVDEDGVPDLAVGSSMDALPIQYNRGALYILSGATGDELYRVDGEPASYTLYGAIIGDATGDGVDDFISAAPFWKLQGDPGTYRGRVRAWSGADGSFLWQAQGTADTDLFGSTAKGAGDVNGDGYADVVVTAPGSAVDPAGKLFILSGLDGTVLDQSLLPEAVQSVATAGFFDAGGSAEVIVGIPLLNNIGGAHIYASGQGGVHGFVDLGYSLKGTGPAAPQLKAYGDLGPGGSVSVKVRRVEPNSFGYWFLSSAAANLPFKGGVFVPDPGASFIQFPVATNFNGEFGFTGTNPTGIPSGLELIHQFWFFDAGGPQGVSATNGLAEIFK